MPDSDLDNIDINQELEFNNGVGDALKQREDYTFSWKKTASVLSIGLIVIVLITFGILEIGKRILNINDNNSQEVNQSISLNQAMKEANDNNWDVLPEDNDVADAIEEKKISVANSKVDEKDIDDIFPQPTKAVEKQPTKPEVTKVESSVPLNRFDNANRLDVTYRVLAGSYSNYNNAQMTLDRIKKLGYKGYIWKFTSSKNIVTYKVQVGAFKSSLSANKLVNQLKKQQFKAYVSTYQPN